MRNAILTSCFTLIFSAFVFSVVAQPGTTIELDKPEKYEKRKLGSEKTTEKKLSFGKRLYQNTVTHYNYYFNANLRLHEIIERAKASQKDDYTKLLPFYNYTLEATSSDGDLDSVIYKCTAGILLHDLRNDWIDDMYMLLGKAYYYRKYFDSASLVFKFINYAWAQKDKDYYDIPIGSNESSTNGIFSISTKEDNTFLKRLTAKPPSRNEALLWLAKTYTQDTNYSKSAGILEILRHDPEFPERLQTDLHEAIAYWYYTQNAYDSAAFHLSKALENSENNLEYARWEFITAQLYQLSGNNELAIKYYNKSAEHTTDPVMEVYANLNSISSYKSDSVNVKQQKLENLMKMARRDKYVGYRDIIYYAIAQLQMDMNNPQEAEKALRKSVGYSTENPAQKSKSFLILADISYDNKKYVESKNFYDSIEVSSLNDSIAAAHVDERLSALNIIAGNINTIHVQDSLQAVARMPKAERDALIRKMVRQLRKAQGLKEEESNVNISMNPAVRNLTPVDMFGNAKGSEWYFNNLQLKSSGANEFKAKWGSRPNVDNWRRMAAVSAMLDEEEEENEESDSTGAVQNIKLENPAEDIMSGEISFETLLNNLPLTEEKLQASDRKIAYALFDNGKTFQNYLEDYPAAIDAYQSLNNRFPANDHLDEALFNLYYCYRKIGNKSSADSARMVLNQKFKESQWTAILSNPPKTTAEENAATKKYEDIYNLFIEGKFEEAKAEKAQADSVYGNSYWTPQLLYIESIYYVSKREDSAAIDRLNNLVSLHSESPMAEKAKTMIDVLQRRAEIEGYLTALQITRDTSEEASPVVNLNPLETNVQQKPVKVDSVVSNPITQAAKAKVDTTMAAAPVVKTYVFNAGDAQFVGLILDKVDPVYVNEARNAFNRYNKATFYNQTLNINNVKLDDRYNLMLVGPFGESVAAVTYVDKTRPIASSRIVPWLTPDKYTFTIISQYNLDILKETKDFEGYKKLLQQAIPGKFDK